MAGGRPSASQPRRTGPPNAHRPACRVDTLFDRVGMDLIGSLEWSARGFRFVLVLVDYSTRYPEAVPLRNITAHTVAEALFKIFTRVGIPKTDGLVERFNRTLKNMIAKFMTDDPRHWDQLLDPLLFAVREVPQASTGCSPFELLYGRCPRGVLDIQAQERQARAYKRETQLCHFTPGEKVLVLLPTSQSKLLAKWQEPFLVTRRFGKVNYEVLRSDRGGAQQIYHLNLLKRWQEAPVASLATTVPVWDELGPELPDLGQTPLPVPVGPGLTEAQQQEVAQEEQEFADVFSPLPGRTTLIQHWIQPLEGGPVRSRLYRVPVHKQKVIQDELDKMLRLGIIEESHSHWNSPVVLVPKPDGSIWFCVDYRSVNTVTKFDAYSMPWVDELLDWLGSARFYSTLDLTKGYWQIPLSPESKEISAFSTPFGLHQFVTLPFGLHGAPATFQRLMDRVLTPHAGYAAAYFDDVIIYSPDWSQHLVHLRAVLQALREAGLTANPAKCAIGRGEIWYLGFILGNGQIRPQINKQPP
ncbi:uncharacterized protein LOC114912049 [Scleropages formosus]|uniref:uncharacterized protein LOC114912049 n=1 Tax=Scleropages formosus TaxID=113540 RepID=UPI0010FAB458|nr:uncharacterized protein LOC114912049 [Scleropages formosus]